MYLNVVNAKYLKFLRISLYYSFKQHFKASVNLKLSYLGGRIKKSRHWINYQLNQHKPIKGLKLG